MPIDVGGYRLSSQMEDYLTPSVTVSGLLVDLDAGDSNSYSGTGTTWTDLSGNGVNGTFQTQPTFIDGNDGAFIFDGIPEYSNTTPTTVPYPAINIDLRRDFSIEMWVMPHSPGRFRLFGQGTSTQGMNALLEPVRLNVAASDAYGYVQGRLDWSINSTNYTTFSNVFISRYTWNHFVFTYNHSSPYTKGLYVNGTSITPTSNSSIQYAGTGNLRLGMQQSDNLTFWRSAYGRYARIRIYDKILSQSEVTSAYNATSGRYTTLDNGSITTPSGTGAFACEYLVIAGGAGGGAHYAGGGGAGGYREGTLNINTGTSYTIAIGGGGSAGTYSSTSRRGGSGSNSVFHTVTSSGGGGGGGRNDSSYNYVALSGGSGGGGGNNRTGPYEGAGNWPFVSPPQGNDGGMAYDGGDASVGGGGGGAGGRGINGKSYNTAEGGPGKYSSITGTSTARAGGGGGSGASSTTGAAGGVGGGGNGGSPTGGAGSTNTGGGGGGGRNGNNGGPGGSGVVILKYPSARTISLGVGIAGTTTTVGSFKVTTITSGTGTLSFS